MTWISLTGIDATNLILSENVVTNLKSINELDAKDVVGIFFDIDDTFSTDGKITSDAYSALWNLKNAGKIVVPITGRPAGWCDHMARFWPVDAVIGENGAFYFIIKDGKMVKEYTANTTQRVMDKERLAHVRDEILEQVPAARVASDQDYREFDLAIDFGEDVDRLSDTEIDKIVETFGCYGANAKISSIHVNGWFGGYDKLTTAKKFVRKELGIDLDEENEKFVFCGDSPNDEPLFGYFKNSVGVQNVMEFENRLKTFPKYITNKPYGEGFAELVNRLIEPV